MAWKKYRPLRLLIKACLCAGLIFALVACTSPEERLLTQAKEESEKTHYLNALILLEKVIARGMGNEYGVRASREAARISFFDLKDFKRSSTYYRQLVLSSTDADERLAAQKQLVAIFFDHLADYPQAIIELNKALPMVTEAEDKKRFKVSLARAYYYQNNFEQSLNEVEEFLKNTRDGAEKFELLMLKGNILLGQKDLNGAAATFKEIISSYPEKSSQENVAMTLAVCYEEMKDYKNAIATLEKAQESHSVPEYVKVRIDRLKERQKNQPGARGFRK